MITQYRVYLVAFLSAGLLVAGPLPPGAGAEEPPALANEWESANDDTKEVAERPALDSEKARLSYAIGAKLAKDLRAQSIDISPELLIEGLRDGLTGAPMLMSEQDSAAALGAMRQDLQRKRGLARRAMAAENKRKGAAFLEANRKEEGVITLESGLQYRVLEKGDGPRPAASDIVEIHYRASLIDGTEFESSYKRGESVQFQVGTVVIAGWRQALQLMPVGSKWQIFVPAELAYGERGQGRLIEPNATLVFEVALLSIKENQAGGPAQRSDEMTGVADIKFAFKLDPRLLGGTYGQVGWISPKTYQGVSGQDTVDVRAQGFDARGKPIAAVEPEWTAADPDLVAVSPSQGREVKITAKRAGETTLKVTAANVTRTLTVKVEEQNGDSFKVNLTQ